MIITDVQACVIGRQEEHSGGSVWTFVRIYTDEGIVGTGECNSGGRGYSGFATKEAILAMKPLLIGARPVQHQHDLRKTAARWALWRLEPCAADFRADGH